MTNEWLLKDASAAYIIFRWRPLQADEKAAEFIPTPALISSWLDNLSLQTFIREMYEAAYGKPVGKALDYNRKRELVNQLESAFQRRLLICLRASRVVPGAKTVEGEKAPPPPKPAPPPPTKTKTWIEIELVDDKGKPVVGERYRIILPDGSQEEDRLDGHGRARINNLDPGECQISFPDIDGREWGPA
jgi:hypothetical protein